MSAPPPRSLSAAAWDSVRRKLVLFGGRTLTPAARLGDTWEWNGTSWTEIAVTGPAARANHAMVYDAARQVVVLFGGSDSAAFGDTWNWNGTTWTLVSSTGPSARTRHRMAYDAQRQRVVLFGGVSFATGTLVGDTWEWDGANWTQRTFGSGPNARNYHAMAYDPVRQRVLLNGGNDGSSNAGLTDTWTYDGVSWTLQGALSAGFFGKGASFDERRQRVVEFGGYSGPTATTVFTNELWEWDGSTWAQQTAAGPSARRWPAMAWDGVNQKTLLFGGDDGNGVIGDTWLWGL